MSHYRLALIGFGNVGKSLARLLLAKERENYERYAVTYQVTGILTGKHGAAINPACIDLDQALRAQDLSVLSTPAPISDGFDFIRRCGADVLFENSPVNYETGQPAVDHIKTALELGMHAITSNKGPVVHAYHSLKKLAESNGKRFFFESTVMEQYGADATPSATLPPTPKDSFLAGVNIGFGSLDIIYGFAHNAGNGATNQKFGTKVSAGEASFMIQAENVDQGGYDPVGEGQFMTGIITYAVGNWLWVVEIAEYNTDYADLTLPTPITGANSSLFTLGGRYYLAKNAWLVFGIRNTDSENDAVDSSATEGGIRFDF